MSFTYLSLHLKVFGQDQASIAELITRLAAVNPARAHALSCVDWVALRKALAIKALELVSQQSGGTLSKSYQRPTDAVHGQQSPKGECLGVISQNGMQVGLFLQDGNVTLYWSEWHRDHTHQTPKKLAGEVQAVYKDQCIQAAMQLMTNHQVLRVEQDDGTILYEAQIQEVK